VKLIFPLTYRISVNSNNVQSLLDAANQYQIEPVKKMCVDFLKEQVDASNCLGKKYQIPGFFFFFFLILIVYLNKEKNILVRLFI
jgi:hypothetical protein